MDLCKEADRWVLFTTLLLLWLLWQLLRNAKYVPPPPNLGQGHFHSTSPFLDFCLCRSKQSLLQHFGICILTCPIHFSINVTQLFLNICNWPNKHPIRKDGFRSIEDDDDDNDDDVVVVVLMMMMMIIIIIISHKCNQPNMNSTI